MKRLAFVLLVLSALTAVAAPETLYRDSANGGLLINTGPVKTRAGQLLLSDGVAVDASLANKQPLDSDLTAIAALATDPFGRALLTKTDAASIRTYIGAGTSSFDGSFPSLTSKPTTIAGYGITDFNSLGDARWSLTVHTHAFSSLTSRPTTLSGYGITDAQPLDADLTAVAALATDSFGLQLLTKTTAAAIRTYIGAGTSSFDGSFPSLTSKPTTIAGYGITDFNSLGDARWQPLDSDLTTWAGITPGTGVGAALAVATNSSGGFSPIDGTATLTNKTMSWGSNTFTLTSAQLRAGLSDENGTGPALFDGSTSAAFTTPKVTTGILDANGNSMFAFTATASAVDGITVTNAATANPATVTMAATGNDSNINIALNSKGTGALVYSGDHGEFNSTTALSSIRVQATSGGNNRLWFGVEAADVYVAAIDSFPMQFRTANTTRWAIGATTGNLSGRNDEAIGWSSSTTPGTNDTALYRNSAATVEVNTGTAGNWGSAKIGNYDAGTNTVTDGLTLSHKANAVTPAAGYGEGILFNLNSSTTADQNAARIYTKWSDATHATRTSKVGIQAINNAGALTDVVTFNGDLSANFSGSAAFPISANLQLGFGPVYGRLQLYAAGGTAYDTVMSMRSSNSTTYGFDWKLDDASTGNVKIQRVVAGSASDVVEYDRSTGTTIFGGRVRLKAYTVATLPAGTEGDMAYVTDATAPTYNGALTGGGSVKVPVFYNGTAWVSH